MLVDMNLDHWHKVDEQTYTRTVTHRGRTITLTARPVSLDHLRPTEPTDYSAYTVAPLNIIRGGERPPDRASDRQ